MNEIIAAVALAASLTLPVAVLVFLNEAVRKPGIRASVAPEVTPSTATPKAGATEPSGGAW